MLITPSNLISNDIWETNYINHLYNFIGHVPLSTDFCLQIWFNAFRCKKKSVSNHGGKARRKGFLAFQVSGLLHSGRPWLHQSPLPQPESALFNKFNQREKGCLDTAKTGNRDTNYLFRTGHAVQMYRLSLCILNGYMRGTFMDTDFSYKMKAAILKTLFWE